MDHLSRTYGSLLDALMGVACLLLLVMALLIGADVAGRNAELGGIPWSGEISEDILYLLTLLTAPWLLRRGQHIRVDILLRALPSRVGWLLEWLSDLLGLACSLYFVWYGWRVVATSYRSDAISIKTLVMPEWWLLTPLPLAFLMLAIEFVFRMHRLSSGERAPRTDAVSAS